MFFFLPQIIWYFGIRLFRINDHEALSRLVHLLVAGVKPEHRAREQFAQLVQLASSFLFCISSAPTFHRGMDSFSLCVCKTKTNWKKMNEKNAFQGENWIVGL